MAVTHVFFGRLLYLLHCPLFAIRNFCNSLMGSPRTLPHYLLPSGHKLLSFVIFIQARVEALGNFEGDLVLESASEAYGDLSCETLLDTKSFEIKANFLDSELSSFLVPRVMTIRVLFDHRQHNPLLFLLTWTCYPWTNRRSILAPCSGRALPSNLA
ncbi:hypothetical protein ACH5RR_015790 [Cinchona calisaya]|uniref:Uncharacterized protein n=1 Tax=Cinchona calisaya TaxID=153742 RepID=A0ABD2ZW27_9GENT